MRKLIMAGVALTTFITSPIQAQEASEEIAALPAEEADPDVKFSIGGGYEHDFVTEIDRGGEFSIDRFDANLALRTDFTSDLHFSLRFNYAFDQYDFEDEPFGLAIPDGEPWEDIHTVGAAAIFTLDLNNQLTGFAGPVVESARESGADWGDGLIGGGVIGAAYEFSDSLTLGGGVGVVSQIEDNARLFPILILEWELTDTLRLSSQAASGASGRSGVELICTGVPRWEFALGVANEFERFRLDDEGVGPDGVGQNEYTSVWVRAAHDLNDNIRLSALAGLNAGAQLRLEDEDGDRIAEQDYDTGPFVGFFANVRF